MWPYNTDRWRILRSAKLALSPICEACGSYQALEVHHRDTLTEADRERRNQEKGYPPPALLKTYCKPCHSRITRGESSRVLTAARAWDRFLNEGK